jgi:hypothetical protein
MTSKGTNLTNEIRAAISTATNGRVKTFRTNAAIAALILRLQAEAGAYREVIEKVACLRDFSEEEQALAENEHLGACGLCQHICDTILFASDAGTSLLARLEAAEEVARAASEVVKMHRGNNLAWPRSTSMEDLDTALAAYREATSAS